MRVSFSTIFLAGFLGHGCVAKKMAARHADTLLEGQILKRLPLYEAQKKNLKSDVNQFLNEQRPLVKKALPTLSSLKLEASKIDEQYGQLNLLYRQLALNFSKLMSKYMGQLDKKQARDFDQRLSKENEEISQSKLQERVENIFDRMEIFLGSLTVEQKQIFKDHQDYFEERHKLRVKRREILHDRFREIYRLDLSQEARAEYFYSAYENYQMTYPESEKNKDIIKQLIRTLSPKQKENLRNRLQDLKEIIQHYLETDY